MSLIAQEINATFDGNVFRPAGPVSLLPDSSVRLLVLSVGPRDSTTKLPVQAGPDGKYHDLDQLSGTWTAEDLAEFEAATEWTRRIEPEDWQ